MKILRLALLLASAMLLSGCWVFHGGGWFWSEYDSTKRVNVGVNGTCTDVGEDEALGDLELTFHDRGFPAANVYGQNPSMKKHMVIMARNPAPMAIGYNCEDAANLTIGEWLVGIQLFTYCPQGVNSGAECGTGEVYLSDTGDGGPDKGDAMALTLTGGFYDGYQFAGVLQGGNFTVESNID